eukprot:6387358-Pyramimonas_sp.AAC.3
MARCIAVAMIASAPCIRRLSSVRTLSMYVSAATCAPLGAAWAVKEDGCMNAACLSWSGSLT